jgi:hypothetical protein
MAGFVCNRELTKKLHTECSGKAVKDLVTKKVFQISISVSLSCLAKELCIPIIASLNIVDLLPQIYGQTAVD